MLTPGIHKAYERGVQALSEHNQVETVARGRVGAGVNQGQGALFATDAKSFMADERLGHEVFGSSSLVVRCPDVDTLVTLSERLEGQLTATLQMEPADTEIARRLLPILERKCGRILANGWPTGVEVGPCDGPWRAVSSDLGQPHDLGRLAGDPALPAARLLSGPGAGSPARGTPG